MQTIIKPNKGDKVLFPVDRSLLEINTILLNSELRACFPEQPAKAKIVLTDTEGREYPLVLDNVEGSISGRGLKSLLRKYKRNYLYIELLDSKNLRYRISESSPLERLSVYESHTDLHGQDLPVGNDSLSFEDDNLKVLERLDQRVFESARWYDLHNRALGLSASLGFESLTSTNVMRGVILYQHQLSAVRAVLRRFRGRALLCDEVGLGKTIEAGIILLEYIMRGMVKKVLILTPPSLTTQWQEEMRRKFNLDFILHDSKAFKEAGPDAWRKYDLVIASLHTAKRKEHSQHIKQIYYDMIIVDEAHHLKDRTTMSWKFVNSLKKRYILLLTATPVQNSLDELFNLVTLLKPGQLSTARAFARNFIARGDKLTPKNIPQLRNLLSEVMIRNKRGATDVRFTKRFAHTIKVELSDAETDFYDEMTQFLRTEYPRLGSSVRGGLNLFTLRTLQSEAGSSICAVLPTLERMLAPLDKSYLTGQAGDGNSDEVKGKLRSLYHKAKAVETHSKINPMLEVVNAYADKIIIFTRFRQTQDLLYQTLNREGYRPALYHGGMRRIEKEENIERFSEDAKVLISTEVGGEGRNLQFCNAMLNYDLPWNPMRIEQRIGRIHRVGQKRDVHIFNLSAEKTIESYILNLLDAKINMFELVVGELDMILGNLDDDRPFEDIIMDILVTSRSDQELEAMIEEFGEKLLDARRQYIATREYEERLFRELVSSDEAP